MKYWLEYGLYLWCAWAGMVSCLRSSLWCGNTETRAQDRHGQRHLPSKSANPGDFSFISQKPETEPFNAVTRFAIVSNRITIVRRHTMTNHMRARKWAVGRLDVERDDRLTDWHGQPGRGCSGPDKANPGFSGTFLPLWSNMDCSPKVR